jgi:hypothetical protein
VRFGGLPLHITDANTAVSSKPWRDDSFAVGVAGYYGHRQVAGAEGAADFENRFWRVIGKLRGKWSDLDLMAAVSAERDDNPAGTDVAVDSLAWMFRADYVAFPWLQFERRYDKRHLDDAVLRTVTPNIHAFLLMNVFLKLEATVELGPEAAPPEVQLELFLVF